MSHLQEAFEEACADAVEIKDWYCTLYVTWRWYGGAEEGGWWGSTVQAEAFERFNSKEEAEAALEAVKKLAVATTKEAKKLHGDICLNQLDYCERRGIDDANSVFGEIDEATSYSVRVENKLGSSNYQDSKIWE